ncbi:MAG: cytochrome b/b6 domain-containing protein [Pseudomonadota bacterium]
MAGKTHQVSIWDWPVRLCHWSFALLVPAMWWTAENSEWGWHLRLGHVLLAVLLFRIIWGFIGTRTARFSQFVKGPGAVLDYLRGRWDAKREIGHSPLGALAVLALLSLMLAQVVMGLFAGDPFDGATGPLNDLVSISTADFLTDTHEWFYWVVFGMVGVHLCAIGFYGFIRMDDLISPMVSGGKMVPAELEGIGKAPGLRAAGALVVAISVAVWVWFGAPGLG